MAYTIKPKRSNTSDSAPTTANLSQGEIAINPTDGSMFTKNVADSIVRFGIVEGPHADGQVPRYDGTKHVSSLVTIDAAGIIAGDGTSLTNVNALTVNSTGIVVLSQAAYNALTPVATTLYFIV